jgi:DnaJ-class molecular chaperone
MEPTRKKAYKKMARKYHPDLNRDDLRTLSWYGQDCQESLREL